MLRSILVPLDGSTFAEHALPIAAGLARRAGAVLGLAHAHAAAPHGPTAGVAIPDVGDLRERQDEQAYLTDVARRLAGKAPVAVETVLLDGHVVAALAEYARRESVDLVVMSTHARGVVSRFWLGSVSDDLAAALSQPLLLVRPGEGKPNLAREAALRSIVVPLDGTELAEHALEPALTLAELFDAEVTLVRVNLPAALPAYSPDGPGAFSVAAVDEAAEIERREDAASRDYLAAVAARLAGRSARVRTHVVFEDSPAAGILAEAHADHADLIAIETHARRGLARLFFGSVADAVVRGSAAPVLLHHAAAP